MENTNDTEEIKIVIKREFNEIEFHAHGYIYTVDITQIKLAKTNAELKPQ